MIKKIIVITLILLSINVVQANENYKKILFYNPNLKNEYNEKFEDFKNAKDTIKEAKILDINTFILTELENSSQKQDKYIALHFEFYNKAKKEIKHSPNVLNIGDINVGLQEIPIQISTFKKLPNEIDSYSIDLVRIFGSDNTSQQDEYFYRDINTKLSYYDTYAFLTIKNLLNKPGKVFTNFSFYDDSLNLLKSYMIDIPLNRQEIKTIPICISDFDNEITKNAKFYNINILDNTKK